MSNIFNLSSSIDERGKTKLRNTCFRYRGGSTARVVVIRKLLVVHTTKADDVCATNGVEKKRRLKSRVGKRILSRRWQSKKKENQNGLCMKKRNFLYNIIYLFCFYHSILTAMFEFHVYISRKRIFSYQNRHVNIEAGKRRCIKFKLVKRRLTRETTKIKSRLLK